MWILNLDSEKAIRELAVATESEVKKYRKLSEESFLSLVYAHELLDINTVNMELKNRIYNLVYFGNKMQNIDYKRHSTLDTRVPMYVSEYDMKKSKRFYIFSSLCISVCASMLVILYYWLISIALLGERPANLYILETFVGITLLCLVCYGGLYRTNSLTYIDWRSHKGMRSEILYLSLYQNYYNCYNQLPNNNRRVELNHTLRYNSLESLQYVCRRIIYNGKAKF